MAYRVFRARWWADEACTIPIEGPRETETIQYYQSEEQARERCRRYNYRKGERVQRPYGEAYEYEQD